MAALRVAAFRWLVQTIAVVALLSGAGQIWLAPDGAPESPAVTTSEPRATHGEKAATHEQATPRVARAPLLGRLPPILPGPLPGPLFAPLRALAIAGPIVSASAPSGLGVEVFFLVRRRIPRMGSEEPPSAA